jgi:hypothetical protein
MFILVLIDVFSRWVELFPTKTTTALESASCIFQHMGRFGTPEVVNTDHGTAFHNELVSELLRMTDTEQSLVIAYSSEENGIVERANQDVLCHLNAIFFNFRIHDKRSYEQLPMVQRIMNTVEKTSTGVTPAALILNNSIRLTERILLPPTQARSSGHNSHCQTQWTIEDLISGKRTTTHIHNLRPFSYDPDRMSPLTVAQQNE